MSGATKAAPRPWLVIRSGGDARSYQSEGAARVLARLATADGGPSRAVQRAHAQAAPELLDAVRAAVPCIARAIAEGAFDGCAAPHVGASALEQCEAALALATKGGAR